MSDDLYSKFIISYVPEQLCFVNNLDNPEEFKIIKQKLNSPYHEKGEEYNFIFSKTEMTMYKLILFKMNTTLSDVLVGEVRFNENGIMEFV